MPPDIMVSPASLPAPAGSAPGTTTPGKTATGPPGTDALSALFASLLAQSSTAAGTLPKTDPAPLKVLNPGVPNPGVPNPGVPNPGVPNPGVLTAGSQKIAVSVTTEQLKTTGNSKTMDTDPVRASLPQEKKSTTGDELLLPQTQADVPVAAPLPGLPTTLLPVLVALTPAFVTPMPVLAVPSASVKSSASLTPSLASVTPLATVLPAPPGKSQAVVTTPTPTSLPGLPLPVSTQPLEARASALVSSGNTSSGNTSSANVSSAALGLPIVALSASAPQELTAAPTQEIALPRTFALNPVSRRVLTVASQVLTQAPSVSTEKPAPNSQAVLRTVSRVVPQGPSAPTAEAMLKTQITSQASTMPQSPSLPAAQAVLAATTSADAKTAGDQLPAVSHDTATVAPPKLTPSAIVPQTVPANTSPPAAAPPAVVSLSPVTPSVNPVAVTLVAANPVIASAVMASAGTGAGLPNVSGKPADKAASSTFQNSTLQNSTPNSLKSAATSADTQTVINTGSITAGTMATASVEKKPTTDSLLAVGAKRSGEKLGSKDQSDPEITQTGTAAAPLMTETTKTATPSLTAADRAAIVQQVADGVGAMPVPKAPGTPEQMTLQLHPKDWGKLHVSVTLTPGPDAGSARTVTAHIVADTPQVKAALESGQGELHQTLREAGLHLEHLTVSVKPAEVRPGEVKSASDSAPSGMPFDQSRQDAGGGFSQGSAGQGTSGQGSAGQTPDASSSNGTPSFASFAGGHPGGRQGQSSPSFAGTSYRAEPEPDTVPVWNAATRSASGRIDLHA